MVDVGSFKLQVHALLLKNDQYELLVEAREEMYGEQAAEVSLASVIALLAKEELMRYEEPDEETMFDATGEAGYDINEEHPR